MLRSRWHSGVVVMAMAFIGFAVALTSGHRAAVLWPIWAALAASVAGVAGAVGWYGVLVWRALPGPLAWRRTWLPTLIVGGTSVVVVVLTEVLARQPGAGWRGDILAVLTMVGGGCAGLAMFGVRAAVRTQAIDDDLPALEAALVALVRLRRTLQRLSSALGALVGLATLTLGVGTLLGGGQSPALVVVYGAAGSFVVGAFHSTVAGTVRTQGEHIAGLVLASAAPATAADVVDRLEQRARLEQLVGAHRTLFSDLQSAIPVLSPVIATATVFLPH
jgi:hypothetical protein